MLLAIATAGTATPAPSPLHEIGRDEALGGVCGSLVVHANAAIAAELRARRWLEQGIARLRGVDLEGNPIARRNGLAELSGLSAQIHDEAGHGGDEIRRLSEVAGRTEGLTHRDELRPFADAMFDAFAEERRTAADLASLTSYLINLETRGEKLETVDMAHLAAADPLHKVAASEYPAGPLASPYETAGSPNRMARAAAADFAERLNHLAAGEARAAAHSGAAVEGCS
jgi:hypothetical protein